MPQHKWSFLSVEVKVRETFVKNVIFLAFLPQAKEWSKLFVFSGLYSESVIHHFNLELPISNHGFTGTIA